MARASSQISIMRNEMFQLHYRPLWPVQACSAAAVVAGARKDQRREDLQGLGPGAASPSVVDGRSSETSFAAMYATRTPATSWAPP